MSEEYLWDGQGQPDARVAELESLLAPLRFEQLPVVELAPREAPAPGAAPAAPVRRLAPRVVSVAAAVAAALLIWWWKFAVGSERAPEVRVEHVPVAAPPALPTIVVSPAPDGPVQEKPAPASAADAPPPDAEPARSRRTASKRSKRSRKPERSGSTPALTPAPDVATTDVDCIIDPSQCEPPADPDLPDKLSAKEIKDGMAAVKAAVRACGPRHGGLPGVRIKVKLSISGATGRVTRASAQTPHTRTPLGQCVAEAVKQAKFPRFRRASLGVLYPFTL